MRKHSKRHNKILILLAITLASCNPLFAFLVGDSSSTYQNAGPPEYRITTDKHTYFEGEPIQVAVESRWQKPVPRPYMTNAGSHMIIEAESDQQVGYTGLIAGGTRTCSSESRHKKLWKNLLSHKELASSVGTSDSGDFPHLVPDNYEIFYDTKVNTRKSARIEVLPVPDELADSFNRYKRLRWYCRIDWTAPIDSSNILYTEDRIDSTYRRTRRKPPEAELQDSLKSIMDFFWTRPRSDVYRADALETGARYLANNFNGHAQQVAIDTSYILRTVNRYLSEKTYDIPLRLIQRVFFKTNLNELPNDNYWQRIDSFENRRFSKYARKAERRREKREAARERERQHYLQEHPDRHKIKFRGK